MVLINAMRTGIMKPKRHLFARCVLSGVNCSFKWWNDGWMMDYGGYWEKRTWITLKNHPRNFHEGLRKTTQDMWDLRFLWRYWWDSMSCGRWRRVVFGKEGTTHWPSVTIPNTWVYKKSLLRWEVSVARFEQSISSIQVRIAAVSVNSRFIDSSATGQHTKYLYVTDRYFIHKTL